MSIVVGLTGQSGAGKTMVSQAFQSNGFAVINCDEVTRKVQQDGSECNHALAGIFPECFDKAFKLDRQKLAKSVFSDKHKLETLNNIIYPYITDEIIFQINKLSKKCQYILLDAPTLFEAGADKLCNVIVAVAADKNIRLQRILKRDGISEEQIKNRFNSQHSCEYFKEHCDYVIYNNSSAEAALLETERIIKIIKEN